MNVNLVVGWIFAFVIVVLMPVAFLLCLRWLMHDRNRYRQLREAGVTVAAHIISRHPNFITRGRRYFVRYAFKTNPNSSDMADYSLEQEVNRKHYQRLLPGTSVRVSYLPNDPRISCLTGTDEDHTDRLQMTAYTLILGMVWLGFLAKIIEK